MWVRFTRDFDFSPSERKGAVTIAYKAGVEANVTRECADLALTSKAATAVKESKDSGKG